MKDEGHFGQLVGSILLPDWCTLSSNGMPRLQN